jgi:hypothetical protein
MDLLGEEMNNKLKIYTGIGSRNTPEDIGDIMKKLASKLEQEGWKLRSGGAGGADSFFEAGVTCINNKQIYIPWKSFGGLTHSIVVPGDYKTKAEQIASEIHPAWNKCSRGAKALHTRNVCQVLGADLQTPSKFLVCWAESSGDSIKGGTRTAWEIAKMHNIPCFNLKNELDYVRLMSYMENYE